MNLGAEPSEHLGAELSWRRAVQVQLHPYWHQPRGSDLKIVLLRVRFGFSLAERADLILKKNKLVDCSATQTRRSMTSQFKLASRWKVHNSLTSHNGINISSKIMHSMRTCKGILFLATLAHCHMIWACVSGGWIEERERNRSFCRLPWVEATIRKTWISLQKYIIKI